jgi:hypothetical protein
MATSVIITGSFEVVSVTGAGFTIIVKPGLGKLLNAHPNKKQGLKPLQGKR